MTEETAQLLISVVVINVIVTLALFTAMIVLIWIESKQ